MRVLVLCAQDSVGSAFYRLAAVATVLISQGNDVTVDHTDNPLGIELNTDGTVASVAEGDYDVLVVQRPMTRVATRVTEILQSRGVAVVVELDDDFWNVDKANVFRLTSRQRDNNIFHLTATMNKADMVTVSTPHLATAVPVPRHKVRVLRNCVPLFYTQIKRDPELCPDLDPNKLTVGWTGSPGTHPGDLNVPRYAVRDMVRECGAQFFTIGDEETCQILGFDDEESFWSPWTRFVEYMNGVKCFDVGIVPLKHSPFTYSKSFLKGLEYASLGIPFVASDVPEYEYLNSLGAGIIVRHEGEWRKALRTLLTSESARIEHAGAGLAVAKKLSYEENAHLWWSAWSDALNERRKHG